MKPDEERSETEKLEEKIKALQNRIKNTEYDLANMFRGNALLEQKLENSKKELLEKEALLAKIKSTPKSAQELKKIENNITENNTEPISQEQEKILKQEIEQEL